jgi:hypothetical protein
MASGSFFVKSPEDALRHLSQLVQGLKKVAVAGIIGAVVCGVMAMLLSRFLAPSGHKSNAPTGFPEMSAISSVIWYIGLALIVFSCLYFIVGWGLAQRKLWARYAATGTFLLKVLLCVWMGRGSLRAMVVFIGISGWDLYGLWVLLSKETGQLFSSPQASQITAKPANLVT